MRWGNFVKQTIIILLALFLVACASRAPRYEASYRTNNAGFESKDEALQYIRDWVSDKESVTHNLTNYKAIEYYYDTESSRSRRHGEVLYTTTTTTTGKRFYLSFEEINEIKLIDAGERQKSKDPTSYYFQRTLLLPVHLVVSTIDGERNMYVIVVTRDKDYEFPFSNEREARKFMEAIKTLT